MIDYLGGLMKTNSISDEAILVIISSCIYLSDIPFWNNNSSRSIFNVSDRVEQTIKTIASIKEKLPKARVILADNGLKDPTPLFPEYNDIIIYLGNMKKIRKAADSGNKGIGEAVLMNTVIRKYADLENVSFIIKVSGRYFLDDQFDLKRWDCSHYNFAHVSKGLVGLQTNHRGSYSYELYGFPKNKIPSYLFSNFLAVLAMKLMYFICHTMLSLEMAQPFFIFEKFFLHSPIGVSGYVTNGDWLEH